MPNSVDKTMMILKAVSDGRGEPVSLEKISALTGINKSTASHIISRLCAGLYLVKVSHNLGYTLGPELHMITRYGRYGEKVITVAKPILEYLHRKTGAVAIFAILAGDKKYIIDRYPENAIYKDTEAQILGDDLYRTVTGRVLLANITTDKALEIYKTLGTPKETEWKEASTPDSFLAELSKIRSTGCYYQKAGESKNMWHSFALPVIKGRKCEAALGLAVKGESTADRTDLDKEKYSALMIKCKKEIERRLKFL